MPCKYAVNLRSKCRPPVRRRAVSLIEMMVSVTLSSLLLGVVVSLAVCLQRWDLRFRDHSLRNEQLARLADTLRSDIRSAGEVSLASKKVFVVATPDQTHIRYKILPEGCLRVAKKLGDAIESRDLFRIEADVSWHLDEVAPGTRSTTVVRLERTNDNPPAARSTELLVCANRGADLPKELVKEKAATREPSQ